MSISDHITWNSGRHTLQIDLSSLVNTPTTLILTSWNHPYGITWHLTNDQEQIDEHYADPFRAPYFPIWECLTDDEACDEYLNQIPKAIAVTLRQYRSDNFGILMLISQNTFLSKLYGKYSTLFWLFFRYAKNDQRSKNEFLFVCSQGELAVLQACQLPANTVALEVIAKFTAEHYAQLQSDYLYRLFATLDYSHLNAVRTDLPDHLVNFLLRYPKLQHAKLIQNLNKADYNELLRIVRKLHAVATGLEIDTVNVELLIAESDNLAELKSHHKHLEALALEKALQDYEKQLKSAEASSRSFPQLSLFADSDELLQIINVDDLLTESELIQQNLMRYVPGILSEHYAVYRMLKPQRASAVYYLFPEQDGGLRPVLKCQYITAEQLNRL